MTRPLVQIVQEYVPVYRAPLFESMRRLGADAGIDLEIVSGLPQQSQAARGDRSAFRPDHLLRQVEFRIGTRRLTMRNGRSITRHADLVVVEQARRNLDVYLDLISRPSRVAMWGHGADRVSDPGRLSRNWLRYLTNRATWFFGYTPRSVSVVTSEGFDPARTTTLWNSTDTASLRKALDSLPPGEVERARLNSGVSDGGLAVFVGAFDESKRLEFLLAAGELIARRRPDFRLMCCGDGPARHALVEAANRAPWLIVRPRADGDQLALMLATADAIAMPGRVGLVAVDALTAGVPIVTTDWPYHAPEFDYLDRTNSAISADSVRDYADLLEEVIYRKDLNQRLRAGSRQVSAELSIERMADNFMAGISRALESKKRSRRQ